MMLRVHGLEVAIGGATILRGVNLEVPDGTIVGLVGRNGAGKTTTLRAIMGLIRVRGGSVLLDEADLLSERADTRAGHGIGYLPEDRRLVAQLSVEENLLLPLWAGGAKHPEDRVDEVVERVPILTEFLTRPASHLSGGQQKLVALGRALTVGRRLLLLDEPFEGLAPALADSMGEAIRTTRDEEGLSVLVVESERRLLDRVSDSVVHIERGATLNATADS